MFVVQLVISRPALVEKIGSQQMVHISATGLCLCSCDRLQGRSRQSPSSYQKSSIPWINLPFAPFNIPIFTYSSLLSRDGGEESGVGLLPALQVKLGGIQRTRQTVVVVNSLDTVGRVDVLDQGDLETGGATLTRDDGGVGKEVLPDL